MDVGKPFKVIGIITHNDPGKYQILTLDNAVPALKEKARSIGANGLKSGIISTGISVKARAILIQE
jgi:tetrahydromethanopterin S-methyltransferase subunit F